MKTGELIRLAKKNGCNVKGTIQNMIYGLIRIQAPQLGFHVTRVRK